MGTLDERRRDKPTLDETVQSATWSKYSTFWAVQHIDWSGLYGPRGDLNSPGVYEVVEWAKTGRGGKVYDLVKASLDIEVCSSRYGLCE